MSSLGERLLAVHDALDRAQMPHAFGGAIALAYCVVEPRGTRDLDVNIFMPQQRFPDVAAVLPRGIVVEPEHLEAVERDGQVRLMWAETPVDVFMNNVPFHDEARAGAREVTFLGRRIPVLGCTALAVFKAMFDRTKDWGDIEAMLAAETLDVAAVEGWLAAMAGPGSEPVTRFARVAAGERP
jgi:hypothetical protein